MRRLPFLVLLATVIAATAAHAQPTARKVLNLFNDICLASTGDNFASATERANDLGFGTNPAGSFVELHATGYSGGWSHPSAPRKEKYCEIGSTTVKRADLERLIHQRMVQNTGRKPKRIKNTPPDTVTWRNPSDEPIYFTVTTGFNDDPSIGATLQVTFSAPGS